MQMECKGSMKQAKKLGFVRARGKGEINMNRHEYVFGTTRASKLPRE